MPVDTMPTETSLAVLTFAEDEPASADRLSDRATDQLRALIVTLALEPGAVVDESALSGRLSFGRTPLREALHRLAEERLIVILPRRAVQVAPITVTDLQYIYETRLAIEGTTARLAAGRATEAQLAKLRDNVCALAAASPGRDPLAKLENDFTFHRLLGKAAGNQYLYDDVRRILGPAMRLTCLAYKQGQPSSEAHDEHEAIRAAVERRDAGEAEAAMRHHIAMAKDRTLNRW